MYEPGVARHICIIDQRLRSGFQLLHRQLLVIPLDYVQADQACADVGVGVVVERFDHYLRGIGRSPDTRRLYVGAVRRWLAAGGLPGHVDARTLQVFLAQRRDVLAPASVNVELKALRAFYRWLESWGEAAAGSRAVIPRQRKVPLRAPRWLTDSEVGLVLGACPLKTFDGLRDHALILAIYATGLRSGEVWRMELGDFLEDDGVLFCRGKGGKHRYVPTGEQLAGVLSGYLHARASRRPGKRLAFWIRDDGLPFRGPREVWRRVSQRIWDGLGEAGGVRALRAGGRPWSGHYPHELRASFATALLHRGMPLTAIAQLMGHADVATTAHYLGVDEQYLRAATDRHPRALRVR